MKALSCAVAFVPAIAPTFRMLPKPIGHFSFNRAGLLMLVDARINGSAPAAFVIDSGSPHTMIDSGFVRQIGLEAAPRVMSINDVEIDLPEPWVIDLSRVPIPSIAKGLVGAEIFLRYVVRLNPLDSTFTVFDPAKFEYDGDGASVPLLVENGKLFLDADLEVPAGKITRYKLRIDTGSESSVNAGILKPHSGVFTSVKIGPYLIRHVRGPAVPPPAIGMEILRRFIITFDASRGRIYLEPTAALREPIPPPPQ